LNYFSYFSEIEDTFIRRRGKHLMLSPMDWVLIEGWKERGVPLHVVVRAIEHAFDSHEAKKQKRTVKTLLYCQEEIEAQYAEWLASRVGGHEETEAEKKSAEESKSPFPRAAVLAHLSRSLDVLGKLNEQRRRVDGEDLGEALSRAVTLLAEIKDDYASAAQPDARRLEDSLTGIERLLDDAIRKAASQDELEKANAEIDSQVKPYKRHMDKAALEQTCENLLRKRLRDHFGVPRLSLFFL
jgi:predicted ribosome quality control (RQC) complex YloA/Tae2 family protein